ncbi:Pentatricopeptide repeat-containing protein [Hirschfeldia incana]|nr:Pentatricopeptide repeat-containing protein [Hirschfeldia incana]
MRRWNKKNVINLVSTSTNLPAPLTPPPPEIYRLPHPPPKPPNISIPPTLTLSPSPHHSRFLTFLETNLPHHQTLTPQSLTKFLNSTLRHHPLFAHHDFAVFTWASTLDAFRHDHDSFLWMSRSLSATHRFSDLRRLLSFVAANPCPCSSGIFSCPMLEPLFRSAVDAFCRAGKMDHALFGFDTMRRLIDAKPNVGVYNTVLNGYVKKGCDMEKALMFYKRMGKERVKVDVCTFNILINGYCKSGEFEMALNVFREMKERGCEPNVVSFNTLIRGFLGKGRIEEGVKMAYEMIELGCGVSEATCEILVDGLCREGLVDDASVLVMDLSRKRVLPKEFDYGSLVEKLCREKKVDRAVEMVEEVWKNNNGGAPCLIACTTLVEGLRKSGRAEKASEFMEKMMMNVGVVPDSVTFNLLLRDLCDSGCSMDANRLRVLATSKGFEPDETTYHVLVSGFSKEGRKKEGEVLVNEMMDKDMVADIFTYNRLMDGLSTGGRFSKKPIPV